MLIFVSACVFTIAAIAVGVETGSTFMAILFGFVAMLIALGVYALYDNAKEGRDTGKTSTTVGLCCVAAIIMVAVGVVTKSVCIGILVGTVAMAIVTSIKSQKARAQKEHKEKATFYQECEKAGITNLNSEKNRQKAILIGERLGCANKENYRRIYEESKTVYEEIQRSKSARESEILKKTESGQYELLNKYAGYTGRNKRIQMLTDERNACQQKEKDWALHGGIASGIAGGFAGAASAMSIQAQNAEIRAQNAANLEALQPLLMAGAMSSMKCAERARELASAIEAAKIKLVSETSSSTVFDQLNFSDTEVTVTETGTCIVKTTVRASDDFCIYDDVKAVIDGTIRAKIYDGETCIGTAPIVFPTYGVRLSTGVSGMCLFCGEPGKTYRVEFGPGNLWAMEL
jgi:UPF0716 family protein affecting phage T7 exclusion